MGKYQINGCEMHIGNPPTRTSTQSSTGSNASDDSSTVPDDSSTTPDKASASKSDATKSDKPGGCSSM